MTKTVSVLALAFLAIVALAVADKAQEDPRITAQATSTTPTPAPTPQPKPAPVRKYTDQQLQDWGATDAVYAWREFDIELGSDHRFNWFEIGVRIEEATEILIPRHGLNETDAKSLQRVFRECVHGNSKGGTASCSKFSCAHSCPLIGIDQARAPRAGNEAGPIHHRDIVR